MLPRREFLRKLLLMASYPLVGCLQGEIKQDSKDVVDVKEEMGEKSRVYVIKTSDRFKGIKELIEHYKIDDLRGKTVALKANYNSADPFPAATHLDTLSAIVDILHGEGAHVILAERSGMGSTRRVLEDMGVYRLAEEKDFKVVVLDELDGKEWIQQSGENWKRGYLFPRVFVEADAIIQTCCLKTHRFGGHFTMSLKNSVGMIAKFDPIDGYNYMNELHTSILHQRDKIAEINTSYKPRFVLMDGISGFRLGGPDAGTPVDPGIMLASQDRVALDAAGVAVLRIYGTSRAIAIGRVFDQEQIARAVELGLGAAGPEDMEVVPINGEADEICHSIERELLA